MKSARPVQADGIRVMRVLKNKIRHYTFGNVAINCKILQEQLQVFLLFLIYKRITFAMNCKLYAILRN